MKRLPNLLLAPMAAAFLPACQNSLTTHSVSDIDGIPVIEISGGIDQAGVWRISDTLDGIEKGDPPFIVIVLDCPGGELTALKDLASRVDRIPVPTLGLVKQAMAGVVLPLAALDLIYVTPEGTIGAAPVAAPPGAAPLPPEVEQMLQKTIEALKKDVREIAVRNGHDPQILLCMIDPQEELKKGTEVHSPKGRLLTLDSRQAVNLSLAEQSVRSPQDLIQIIVDQSVE